MRHLALLILLAAAAGCATPKAKPAGAGPDTLPPQPFVGSPSAADKDSPGALARRPLGILAGTVLDQDRRRVANATISVQSIEGDGKTKPRLTVATDRNGYFDVPGLETGKRYQLVATSQRGDVVWNGRAVATASDVRIAIYLGESKSGPAAVETGPASAKGDDLPVPGLGIPPVTTDPSRIAKDKGDFDSPPPVPATIPGPGEGSRKPALPPPPLREDGGVTTPLPGALRAAPPPAGKAVVPSSVRVGFRIQNFALNDFDGERWELKERRTGKLVLVYCWSLPCPPCRASLPKLVSLQERWGAKGLQVVGVLCDEGDLARRKKGVLEVAKEQHTRYNFPVLFSDRKNCPVRRDLGVFAFPTLRLLDETGRIDWEAEGFSEDVEFRLEKRLKLHLEK